MLRLKGMFCVVSGRKVGIMTERDVLCSFRLGVVLGP